MNGMSLPERRGAAFRQADVLEVALLLELNEAFHHVFQRYVLGNAGGLEKIHLLDAAELFIDEGDATLEVLRADGSLVKDSNTWRDLEGYLRAIRCHSTCDVTSLTDILSVE